jgi:hypothetical protein
MLFIKLHKSYRCVIAICDSGLIGKTFEETFQKDSEQFTKQLDIKESFYKGEPISPEKAIELMKFQSKEDATFNIVGPESIKAALEAEIITEQGIGKIDGVPYALVLL